MKIKDVEKLQDKLDQEFSWRKKELICFKQMIETDPKNTKMLIRAGIALLCAHFEGFIRLASNYYVVYISCKKVPVDNIKNCLLALKLKKKFEECGKTEKTSVHASLINKLEEMKGTYFEIRYSDDDKIIKTESNPTSEKICEIMDCLGLDFSVFEPKKHYIDFSLLKHRHEIVHGERTELEKDDFIETFDIIMQIIEEYKQLIIKAAEEEAYKKCV